MSSDLVNISGRESAYTLQLTRGFRVLRFEPQLEHEYRQHHLDGARVRIIICVLLSMSFSIFAAISNRDVATAAVAADSSMHNLLRIWVMRPLSLVMLLTALIRPLYFRFWLVVAPFVMLVVGVIGAHSTATYVAGGNVHAFIAMIGGFLGVYLLTGMLFWHVAVVSTSIAAGYAYSLIAAGAAVDIIRFEVIAMVSLTGLMLLFLYYLEYSQREAFLQKRVLQDLGQHDALTGLKNRRAFDTALDALWRQALRAHEALGLIMIDVDHFKHYNDHYGHQAGDRCLGKVGQVLARAERRPLDVAARIGGEEFAVLLYGSSPEHVKTLSDKILNDVRLAKIAHARSSVSNRVTVSIGAAIVTPVVGRSPASMLQFVDEALYEAKGSGRDRVVWRQDGYTDLVTGVFRKDASNDASDVDSAGQEKPTRLSH